LLDVDIELDAAIALLLSQILYLEVAVLGTDSESDEFNHQDAEGSVWERCRKKFYYHVLLSQVTIFGGVLKVVLLVNLK